MSTELALRSDDVGMDLATLGNVLAKSGYFSDTRDAAQAIVKVLAGRELGIGPIAAMTGIYLVNGRVAIGANLMAGAVMRSGRYRYRVVALDDSKCEIVFFEGQQELGRSTFTAADAKRAGTKNMDKFPRNMLFARALSNGVRWYCPDVFSAPVYTPEELGGAAPAEELPPPPAANPATGEVIEAEAVGLSVRGTVGADAEGAYNGKGELWINFAVVAGDDFVVPLLAKGDAHPNLIHLEAGDYIIVRYAPKNNRGKVVNLVDSVDGERNADGELPWETRAAAESVAEPAPA